MLLAKVGFALLLALTLTATGAWATCGFAGGAAVRHWRLLWPIWLAAFLSATQGTASDPAALAGWLAVSFAVAFGEEGIFRGIVMTALDAANRPRRAMIVSSVLFGLIHLAGLAAPIDPRMIMGQALIAFALGLVLGGTRLLAASIWPGIIAHFVLDATGLAAAGGLGDALDYTPAGSPTWWSALSSRASGAWRCCGGCRARFSPGWRRSWRRAGRIP